jgi:hypothetical protein
MKKIITLLFLIFVLFSCWLNKHIQKEKMNKVNEKVNLENYISLWAYDEKWLDLQYENKNIKKIKGFLHKKNLSWINLESIKWDFKDVLLLIKNNINKDIELSITLKYSQLNDEVLSILMDYDIKKLWLMITEDCSEKIKNYIVNKDLWNRIINRKVRKLWIELICKNNVMDYWILEFQDKNQLEKLKNDSNFKFDY